MKTLRYILFGHPIVTAAVLAMFGIMANVLSGALTFDITRTDPKLGPYLAWSSSLQSRYSWALVAVVVVTGLYGWGMAKTSQKVRRAFTEAEIRERAYQELLPVMLASLKKDMEQGNLVPMADVFKMIGINEGPRP